MGQRSDTWRTPSCSAIRAATPWRRSVGLPEGRLATSKSCHRTPRFQPVQMGGRIDMTASENKVLEPLGLKLERKRRAVEVVVVDHAEKIPIEN